MSFRLMFVEKRHHLSTPFPSAWPATTDNMYTAKLCLLYWWLARSGVVETIMCTLTKQFTTTETKTVISLVTKKIISPILNANSMVIKSILKSWLGEDGKSKSRSCSGNWKTKT